jgi:hypothetical protein
MKNAGFFILMLFLIASCSVQKRQYMKGYYLSWNKQKKQNKRTADEQPVQTNQEHKPVEQLLASSEKGLERLPVIAPAIRLFEVEECDILLLHNGDEIKVKVTEITPKEIKYQVCGDAKGKVISIDKSKVFMIKYPNGKNEVIKSEESETKVKKTPERVDYQTAHRSKKMQPFSLIGFIFAILAVFSLAIFGLSFGFFAVPAIFGVLAVLCGLIAIVFIKKNPDKYKGKAMAVLAIIFGLIFGGISLAFLALA